MDSERNQAIQLIKDKIEGKSSLSYVDIAKLTNYHPKYILKLKKDILTDNINYIHGNKNRKPANTIPIEDEQKIIPWVIIPVFGMGAVEMPEMYGMGSNILKRNGLLEEENRK